MKLLALAALGGTVLLASVAPAQTTSRAAPRTKAAASPSNELSMDDLRPLARRVRVLRAEPDAIRLHVGQSVDLSAFKVIVVDDTGRQLGFTRAFDFAIKPGEPASVVPKRITGDRPGSTELSLRFPRTLWPGLPNTRPTATVRVTVVK